jgi:hypothetical protein
MDPRRLTPTGVRQRHGDLLEALAQRVELGRRAGRQGSLMVDLHLRSVPS